VTPDARAARDPRDAVFAAIAALAARDPNVFVLTNDMGALGLDALEAAYPAQVVNVGIAEQNMVSVAAGLALGGKLVFTYGILAHVTARCYEQLRLDVCAHGLPVIGLGVGSGLSYGADGPTHHGIYDLGMLRALPGMTVYNPADGMTAGALTLAAAAARRPAFLRLDKEAPAPFGTAAAAELAAGVRVLTPGTDALVIATGCSVARAVAAAARLRETGRAVTVVDCFRLKPFPVAALEPLLRATTTIVTVEEHTPIGGLGAAVAEVIADLGLRRRLRRLALADDVYLGATNRGAAEAAAGLDAAGIVQAVAALTDARRPHGDGVAAGGVEAAP
jgi:transketolase